MSSANDYGPKVIVVGYSPNLEGGVTHVTGVLLKNFSNMELHPYLICYSPKSRAVLCYLLTVVKFAWKVVRIRRCTIVLLIIGSSGDAIRSVPYIWLSKMRGLKICTQYHKSADNIFFKISSGYLSAIVKNALRMVDIHCFLSRRLESGFRDIFTNEFQSKVIPNVLEKKWIDLDVLPMKERCRDIVFFGRWSWEKGVEDLIACMAIIEADVTCEIYTNHLPAEIFKNCKIFPWVKESEVMNIMRTAKLVILPSYAEAYPMVLLEAAACGTPFLASDIAGIPDIVEESGGGRLSEVGNVTMLAKAVDEMLTDEVKWQEMSRNGKAWVRTLSEENIKKQWLDVFRLLDQVDLD